MRDERRQRPSTWHLALLAIALWTTAFCGTASGTPPPSSAAAAGPSPFRGPYSRQVVADLWTSRAQRGANSLDPQTDLLSGTPLSGVDKDAVRRQRRKKFRDALDSVRSALPRIKIKTEPKTFLKIRKTLFPLKTRLTVGADYSLQDRQWKLVSSWQDNVIGGTITLNGREFSIAKDWFLPFSEIDQHQVGAKLRVHAGLNMDTGRLFAKFRMRAERLAPIAFGDGIRIDQRVPLDGRNGNAKLEVKGRVSFPEPQVEYSTDRQGNVGIMTGMGDVEVAIEQLNLCFEY